MALPPALARDVMTILRPQTTIDHGSTVPDWTQPPRETVTVTGCSIQPAAGADDREHRDSISAVFTVWAPVGTVIGSLDRVMVDQYDGPLQISGEPLIWSVKMSLDHVAFDLQAWRG